MTSRPWGFDHPMKTRHCFIEAAYWFVAGLCWQVDRWTVAVYPHLLLVGVLSWFGLWLDDLRMFIAGYSYVALDKKGPYNAAQT